MLRSMKGLCLLQSHQMERLEVWIPSDPGLTPRATAHFPGFSCLRLPVLSYCRAIIANHNALHLYCCTCKLFIAYCLICLAQNSLLVFPSYRYIITLIYFLSAIETCHGMSLQNCRSIVLYCRRAIVPSCCRVLISKTQCIASLYGFSPGH